MGRLTRQSQTTCLLHATLEVLNSPVLMRQISESLAFYRSGKKGLSFKDVFGEPLHPTRNAWRGAGLSG